MAHNFEVQVRYNDSSWHTVRTFEAPDLTLYAMDSLRKFFRVRCVQAGQRVQFIRDRFGYLRHNVAEAR